MDQQQNPDHARQLQMATPQSLAQNVEFKVLLGGLAELIDKNPGVTQAITFQLAQWIVSLLVGALRSAAKP